MLTGTALFHKVRFTFLFCKLGMVTVASEVYLYGLQHNVFGQFVWSQSFQILITLYTYNIRQNLQKTSLQ